MYLTKKSPEVKKEIIELYKSKGIDPEEDKQEFEAAMKRLEELRPRMKFLRYRARVFVKKGEVS
jgi:hypothetical protein